MTRKIDGARLAKGFVWLALLVLATQGMSSLAAPPGGLYFERVGSESGPPPEVITAVYQDRAGFLWIGSRDGLTFYDGYTFTVFEHDPSDPFSISDNTIRWIYEDDLDNLWFGTNTGGLNRLDRSTWRFESFRHDSADPRSLSHDSVYAIFQDSAGNLWVGTQVGLNRFEPETGTFVRYLSDPDDPASLSHDYVYGIYEDQEGTLWISTIGGGLNLYRPETDSFAAYRHDPDDPATLNSDSVLAITEDAAGRLWVSTMEGLNLFDGRTGTFRRFGYDPEDETGLVDPLVTSLALGPPGMLWLGTHGGGLGSIDTDTGLIRAWRHDPARRHSLGSDEVIALFADHSGALWIGTWGGGLNRLTPSSLLLSSSADLARMPEELDIDDVSALMRDSHGDLWIGTRSGDVVRRDLERMVDHHIFYGGSRGTPRIILRFAEDRDGHVWVATNGGVIHLDPRGGEPLFLRHDPDDPASIGPGYVRAILADREGNIWIGSGEGGLQRLDAEGRVVDRFLHDPDDPATLGDDYVTCIRQDHLGMLWVGTRSGGLSSLDPRTGRAQRFLPVAGDESTISHHYLTSIMEDSSGTLWIGTGGGGLNRLDRLKDGQLSFTRFTEAMGLIDDDVMGLLEDDDGSLWLSTKRGLTRFDPRSGSFANFFAADGLPSGEFESGAVTRDSSTLYFGSVKGLVAVPAGSQFPTPEPSPTVVTAIKTAGRELHGDRPVWDLESLEVPWGGWLSLEFAVLDYSADHRHRYSYRLAADQDWIDLGSHREVTFTDLDPGIYEFAVRGRNNQGVWSTAGPPLKISVVPPFWMTGWFRALLAAAVVFFVAAGHRIRMSALQKRNKELLELTDQREKAREQLRDAFNRLRKLTRRLEAAKEDERKHIARELHDDMGPSLTAVIINLQLLANETDPRKKSVRTADTIELVDRMVQRIRDLSLDMRPPLLDELGLLPALSGYLETQADRAGIEIDVNDGAEIGRLTPEIEIAAFRVVQEAVTNVIRHAQATRATVTVNRKNGRLELVIEDDGRGFEVRDTIDRAAAGKALGLLGMQERVGALGGELDISSMPGSGTLIRAKLPLEALP